MVRTTLFTTLVSLMAWAPPVATAQSEALRLGLNLSPPLAYVQENGALDGLLVRYSRVLFERAEVRPELSVLPAPRLFRELQDGQVHFSMLVHAPMLDQCCLLSAQPVMTQVLRIYYLEKAPPIRAADQIRGKSIILLNGYSYAGLAKTLQDDAARNRVEIAKSFDAAFRMLESGRADYLLAYEANARELLASRSLPALNSEVLARYPVHLVVHRQVPDAGKLMRRMEKLIAELPAP